MNLEPDLLGRAPVDLESHGLLFDDDVDHSAAARDFVAEVLGDAGSIYPTFMLHAGLAVQPPRSPAPRAFFLQTSLTW